MYQACIVEVNVFCNDRRPVRRNQGLRDRKHTSQKPEPQTSDLAPAPSSFQSRKRCC